MNLKEAFRYQNFLESVFEDACDSITDEEHCLKTTERHIKSAVDPNASDIVKEIEGDVRYFKNDDVILLMESLISERQSVSEAIGEAKAKIGWDIDAVIATNKFRQAFGRSVKQMLSYNPSKRTVQGTGYRFNNEGDQTPFYYEVEVTKSENYDRDSAKSTMKAYMTFADIASSKIEDAMISSKVDFDPTFDVNDTFEDIMERFS